MAQISSETALDNRRSNGVDLSFVRIIGIDKRMVNELKVFFTLFLINSNVILTIVGYNINIL